MKHGWKKLGVLFFSLLIAFFLSDSETIQAAKTELAETDYHQRIEDVVAMAEFFRSDENFIYEANSDLNETEEAAVKELAEEIISKASAQTAEEKVTAIVSYVREKMEYNETGTVDDAYAMLIGTEEGTTYLGDSENYCQAVRDLCALADIPVFTLLDTRDYSSYAVVMAYTGNEWKFVDVAAESTLLVASADVYTTMSARMQPNSFSFGYTGGNTLIGYAGNIFVSKEAYRSEWNTGDVNAEFNLYFDKELNNVVMTDTYEVLKNASFYGAKQKTDANGIVPHGMVEYVNSIEDVETATTWHIYQGYSQYGVLLQGRVVIDEVVHQFDMGGYYSLMYRELKEKRSPTEEEQEAFTALMSGRMEAFAKVSESLLQDPNYQYFMDNTEEELAVLTAAMEEATSREYLMSVQDLGEEEEIKDAHKAYGIINYVQEHVSYIGGIVVQSSYETLTEGRGTCANYANLMLDLCYLAGIPGFYSSGQLCNTAVPYTTVPDHAYCVVKLDGKWYGIDPTNSKQMFDMETKRNLYLSMFVYNQLTGNDSIYGSYELMMNDGTNPLYGLCYGYDEDGNLQIYYMDRTGPVANYESLLFSTDENGQVIQKDGFITWEKKVTTEKGYEMHLYEAYVRQCALVHGTQVIDGKTYNFPRESENITGGNSGYLKEIVSEHFDMLHATITGVEETYTYTGDYICPKPVVTFDGEVLTEGEDYTLIYTDNKVVTKEGYGTPTVRVEGKGKYYDYRNSFFSIDTKVITEEDVTVSATDLTWDKEMDEYGGFMQPTVTVNAPETDYTISYAGFSGMTQGTITIKGRYNCSGTVQKVVKFNPISLENGEFVISDLSEESYTYRGAKYEPEIEVIWKNEDGSDYRTLTAMEYSVTYENNLEAGTATIKVSGDGHFTGELKTTFTISKVDITKRTQITDAFYGDYKAVYTGEEVMPQIPGITFVNDYTPSIGCKKDTDFVVTADNNINAGNATITMQGIGNYTGTLTQTFRIVPKEYAKNSVVLEQSKVNWSGQVQSPKVTIDGLKEGTDFTVTCQKKISTDPEVYEDAVPQEAAIYSVFVEMINPNYCFPLEERSIRLQYEILDKTYAPLDPSATPTPVPTPTPTPVPLQTPTPKPTQTPTPTPGGIVNPTQEPAATPTPVGTVVVTPSPTPMPEREGTTVQTKVPSVAKVKKVKVTAKKKALLVKWKKAKNISGYQIQISQNKKFKASKKYSLSKKKTKRKISGLKKKKTYYVRIRAYKNYTDTSGKKVKAYGEWVVIKKRTK